VEAESQVLKLAQPETAKTAASRTNIIFVEQIKP